MPLFLRLVAVGVLSLGGIAAPCAAAVRIIGPDGTTVSLAEEEFRKLPHVTVETIDHLGDPAKYSGVPLHRLLTAVKTPLGGELRGPALRLVVRVEAHDDYQAVFALPELDPEYTDRVIILADERDGEPLPAGKGPWQVIVPGEKRQARWVRMVKTIRVLDSRKLDAAESAAP